MSEATDEIGAIKDWIFRGGYEFSLESVGLSRDHELFSKFVPCPPRPFLVSHSADLEEEGVEEDEGNALHVTDVAVSKDQVGSSSSAAPVPANP